MSEPVYWKKYGPRSLFEPVDYYRAIWAVEKRIGRKKLADKLGIGEGSMRSLLEVLRNQGMVETSPSGISLSKTGENEKEKLKKNILFTGKIPGNRLTFAKPAFGLQIKKKISKGLLNLRDMAVREGAEGVTFLVEKDKHFLLPDAFKSFAKDTKKIEEKIPAKGTLILAYGGTQLSKERAAWKIALESI